MRFLITGGAGFVGSNLAISFKKRYPTSEIVAFDNLKRRGSELNLVRLKEQGIQFEHGDIRVRSDLDSLGEFDVVIDGAAEPSVLAGIDGGLDYLIQTNLNGTLNLLEVAAKNKAKFIFLSTSRVYPISTLENIEYQEGETRLEIVKDQTIPGFSNKGVSEGFPIDGSRSFYGSSKYASELFVEEYNKILGLPTIINRCGVISGPYQMGKVDQGVVVLWMARHFWKKKLAYIGFGGTGKQVRDVIHVDDLFSLLDWQIQNFEQVNGDLFNVGGGIENSVSLLELTNLCKEITGNTIEISSVKETRVADIPIYVTDNTKVLHATQWSQSKDTRMLLEEVFQWIHNNEKILKPILG